MGIGSLDPNVPAGTAKASGGAAELRAIKAEVKASFPQLTAGSDIVTRTAAQINKRLIQAGFDVSELSRIKRTLQDLFLELKE